MKGVYGQREQPGTLTGLRYYGAAVFSRLRVNISSAQNVLLCVFYFLSLLCCVTFFFFALSIKRTWPDYISLLNISCIIEYVTNKRTLNLNIIAVSNYDLSRWNLTLFSPTKHVCNVTIDCGMHTNIFDHLHEVWCKIK